MGRQVRSGNCVQVALPLWRNNPEQGLSLIHRRERCTSQHSWLHANVHVRPAVHARWWCVSTHLTPVNVSIPDPCPPTRPLKRACAFNHAGNRDVRNIAFPIKRNYPRLEKDRTKKASRSPEERVIPTKGIRAAINHPATYSLRGRYERRI